MRRIGIKRAYDRIGDFCLTVLGVLFILRMLASLFR